MRWLLLACLSLAPAPAAAGAWAREAGTTFLSFKGALPLGGAEAPETFSLYAERGWSERLTLGAKYDRLDSARHVGESFARWHFSAPDAVVQFAVEGGFSLIQDGVAEPGMTWADRGTAIGAFHLGRGVQTPLGAGWVDARLAGHFPLGDDPNLTTLDVTAGISLEGGHLAMLEFRGEFGGDGDTILRLGPTAAIKAGRTHLTAGVLVDAAGDAPGLAELGIWIEF